ncbi:hypothetical protein Spiaf_1130 [Spirochaeta africana DSM 8902]|uniref:Uncharacterized protein n=1 Tax=Spirochaeta africana (strain ATCC 700263 / DSM 8902 / Z-7692) TaxID=889378 RepID=H9UI72_SPIAZ|nr:hypothetical protein Spiaf_1130 [Spirochaeta africana DSM 8902]
MAPFTFQIANVSGHYLILVFFFAEYTVLNMTKR